MRRAVMFISVVLAIAALGCTLDRIGKVAPDAAEPEADAGPEVSDPDAGEDAPECVLPDHCVIAVEWDCCGGCEVAVRREAIIAELCLVDVGDPPPDECTRFDCEECPARGPCRAGLQATCIEGECAAVEAAPPAETEMPAEPPAASGSDPRDGDGDDGSGGGDW